METRTVHDPFLGADVQVSDRLVDRLRGKYASGPHLPNGLPEFGWRQFQAPPIQHEAAARIEKLEAALGWAEQAIAHAIGEAEMFDTSRHILTRALRDVRIALNASDDCPIAAASGVTSQSKTSGE